MVHEKAKISGVQLVLGSEGSVWNELAWPQHKAFPWGVVRTKE
jgi:hypothetical protein